MMIDKASLAVVAVAANNAGRYATSGVFVEAGGISVATDGCCMAAVSPLPDCGNDVPKDGVVLPLGMVKDAIKALKPTKQHREPVALLEVGAVDKGGMTPVTIGAPFAGVSFQGYAAEGVFPNWREVMPTKKPVFTFALRSAFLKNVLTALEAVGSDYDDGSGVTVSFDFYGERMPVVMRVKNGERSAVGVQMPVKVEDAALTPFQAGLLKHEEEVKA